MGGPRVGWWGGDPSNYDPAGDPSGNQAHHFAAFLILGNKKPEDEAVGIAGKIDNNRWYQNVNDYNLSIKAIHLGLTIKDPDYNWANFQKHVYYTITP
jgi:hypothetical protein